MIIKADGDSKNGCKRSAGKRFIGKIRAVLYSNQPFIGVLKAHDISLAPVAKPSDHRRLFQWVEEPDGLNGVEHFEYADPKGRRHHYRRANQVPLNSTRDADPVNFFEYRLTVDQKVTDHNSWVTDRKVSRQNIVELVKAGRARWKIENETFNTLKNQGYISNITSVTVNTICRTIFLRSTYSPFSFIRALNCVTGAHQYCRSGFSSRKEYWNNLRSVIRLMVFADFDHLLRNVPGSQSPWLTAYRFKTHPAALIRTHGWWIFVAGVFSPILHTCWI